MRVRIVGHPKTVLDRSLTCEARRAGLNERSSGTWSTRHEHEEGVEGASYPSAAGEDSESFRENREERDAFLEQYSAIMSRTRS